jgi:hypothetical protein
MIFLDIRFSSTWLNFNNNWFFLYSENLRQFAASLNLLNKDNDHLAADSRKWSLLKILQQQSVFPLQRKSASICGQLSL